MGLGSIGFKGTVKPARLKIQADGSGVASYDLLVPGTPGTSRARLLRGAIGWFDTHHADDHFTAQVVDVDGIVAPAGTVLNSFADTDLTADKQGWYFPPDGVASIEGMNVGVPADLLAGLYLRIVATKGNGASGAGEYVRINLIWAVD